MEAAWMFRFLMGLVLCFVVPLEPSATLTWYGGPYMGQHHAAYWHGETPRGFPEVVTEDGMGVAAPYDIPFGTVLRFTRLDGSGRYVDLVVIDRLAKDTPGWYDAWPLAFDKLGDRDEGRIKVRVEIVVCTK